MRKKFFAVLFFISFFLFAKVASANNLEVNFFYSKICKHCAAEEKFLDKIEEKYPEVKINRYIANDPDNQDFLKEICEKYDAEKYLGVVPLTFIGDDFFVGFDNDEVTGKKIENSIRRNLGYSSLKYKDNLISLPIIGEIDSNEYSLPALTILLGFLDGFNICSIGVLIFILGLVLAFRSREKTLIFGGIFIVTTAVIYGFLMILWYKLFSFLSSFTEITQILIGILAIFGAFYFLKQFFDFQKNGPTCSSKSGKITSAITSYLKETFKNPKSILATILAIFIFAALITIIEFPCSAAVPVVYTGILAQSGLGTFEYISYIIFFVFLYMIDELIIFLIAVFTMNVWLSSPKFVKWITLAEAIILFFLGIYYLF